MKYLVVNADDYGYTEGINKGIIKAHTEGIVTSTSVMVDGKALEKVRELNNYKHLSVGLHFELKNEDYNFEKEFVRQINEFEKFLGKKPDHLDSHKHSHKKHPDLEDIFRKYSFENSVPVRDMGGVTFIDSFFGLNIDGSGELDLSKLSTGSLLEIVGDLSDGKYELLCHPGFSDNELRNLSSYNDPREIEMRTLTNKKMQTELHAMNVKFVDWSEMFTR